MNHLSNQDLFNNSSSLDTNQIIFWSYFVISHQFESISTVLIMVHKWEHILIILNNDTSIRTYLDDSVHGATLIRTQFGVSCRTQQSKTPWWFMKVTHVRAHLDVCWRPQQLNTPWWFFMVTHQPKHLTMILHKDISIKTQWWFVMVGHYSYIISEDGAYLFYQCHFSWTDKKVCLSCHKYLHIFLYKCKRIGINKLLQIYFCYLS